jgi:hypothetical protein
MNVLIVAGQRFQQALGYVQNCVAVHLEGRWPSSHILAMTHSYKARVGNNNSIQSSLSSDFGWWYYGRAAKKSPTVCEGANKGEITTRCSYICTTRLVNQLPRIRKLPVMYVVFKHNNTTTTPATPPTSYIKPQTSFDYAGWSSCCSSRKRTRKKKKRDTRNLQRSSK